MMLPSEIEEALLEIVSRFDRAGIEYAVGGSAMLALRGFDVTVGDIDLIVGGSDRAQVEHVFSDRTDRGQTDLWKSAWSFRSEWSVGSLTVGVDVIGDLQVNVDGVDARFPMLIEDSVDIAGVNVWLAPLRHWYHLYRVHKPERAQLVATRLSDEEILTGAGELGIGDLFSPTLIVRIGNESTRRGIEEDMSTEQQSSIIQVASPNDRTFDDPASAEIDLDLLNETLEYIRPALQADGGDLVLLGTEGGKVTLQMVGACGGCPLSSMTLTAGIERIVQDRVPGVTEVVSV